jgi:sigma-B regulation protein RsbU (phosphoserine phosphatase)
VSGDELVEESAEDLYEDAPCGFLSSRPDGTIIRVNRTFEKLTGLARLDLVGQRRFQELLTPGGRIYHETHYAPLLQMQGSVREIAVEIVRADGSRLPALINSVLLRDPAGAPRVIRTTVFEASDRRRYEQELLRAQRDEREIAEALQRGLMAGELPRVDGLALEVAYRPGRRGTEVGGDWYDAFRMDDDGDILLLVGDVVGRGIEAAAEMGQLRSAARALAETGAGPAALLTALDRYCARHEVGKMTTIVCAYIEVASGCVRYACAGHPPPLVTLPGSDCEFLEGGRSLPMATGLPDLPPRPEAVHELEPGSSLILYTDGLVERRRVGLDVRLELLCEHAGRHAGLPPAELRDELMAALDDEGQEDDVCLVVARFGPIEGQSPSSSSRSSRPRAARG